MTLVCVPIMVEDIDAALADTAEAKSKGADIVEYRIDRFFSGGDDDTEAAYELAQLKRLFAETTLPTILTCRPTWEGGDYDGDDAARVSLFEKLTAASGSPPTYLDVELAAYTRSANLRQKINLCVDHPDQQRDVPTRLILSTHDFDGRPADLTRKLTAAYAEPAAAVVKVAFRARSLRDNLELFDLLKSAPKPTIALGMGEFGLMSRVLAPKFAGFLTFAALRDESATAPGQPTINDLLSTYRFRTINKDTALYGVIGWPVSHSKGPLIHNAGFEAVGHNGVYLPLPIAAGDDPETSRISFNATFAELREHQPLNFAGASVTIPHKESLAALGGDSIRAFGAANTFVASSGEIVNTDETAIGFLLDNRIKPSDTPARIGIIGAGGVARAAAHTVLARGWTAVIYNRTAERANSLAAAMNASGLPGKAVAADLALLPKACCHAFINCTPIGMSTGPAPGDLSIPIPDMTNIDEHTVFFDTVYTPEETPMLKAARDRGYQTISGVDMFIAQAAEQFKLWTGHPAPTDLWRKLLSKA